MSTQNSGCKVFIQVSHFLAEENWSQQHLIFFPLLFSFFSSSGMLSSMHKASNFTLFFHKVCLLLPVCLLFSVLNVPVTLNLNVCLWHTTYNCLRRPAVCHILFKWIFAHYSTKTYVQWYRSLSRGLGVIFTGWKAALTVLNYWYSPSAPIRKSWKQTRQLSERQHTEVEVNIADEGSRHFAFNKENISWKSLCQLKPLETRWMLYKWH